MAKRYKDEEDQDQLVVQKYSIEYYDYDSEKRVFWCSRLTPGKRVEFYDEVEAQEFADMLHGTEGIYASVVPL